MKTTTKILALGGVATVAGMLGWAALADMPMHRGPHGMGMGMGMGPGMMQHMGPGATHGGPGHAALVDPARVEALKTELDITEAQTPAWDKYAKALQDAADEMKSAHAGIDHESVANMSPTDRMAFATKMHEQGQQRHEAVQKAANDLLATLDDAQKSKAATILPGLADHGPGMMRGAAMGGFRHGHPGR